jgi:uncharacterized protein YbjT (DUF2867 family)
MTRNNSAVALIVVTGATGHVGASLVRQLLMGGQRVRALGRAAGTLSTLAALGAEISVGDLQDQPFLETAFRGADAVFAMTPPFYHAADVAAAFRTVANRLADALISANVPRIVALSGLTPPSDHDPIAALHHFEQRLQNMSGVAIASLCPGFFMENLLPATRGIRHAGVLSSAHLPDVAAPMVATRDVAAAAAGLLLALKFSGYSRHELMGTRDYSFRQAAAILGVAIGKPDLQYAQCSYEEFYNVFQRSGFSASAAHFHVELARTFNEARSSAQRTVTSTTATSLEQFAREVFAPAYNGTGEHVSR